MISEETTGHDKKTYFFFFQDTELGQDVAVEVRGETNGEIVVEYCDPGSLKSIHEFCTRVLEQESRIHVLINNAAVMWVPMERSPEGFETHWAVNHLAAFVMTQLLMPLLQRCELYNT